MIWTKHGAAFTIGAETHIHFWRTVCNHLINDKMLLNHPFSSQLFQAHLYAGCDLIVALGHDVNDVFAVRLQETNGRPGDPLSQGLVGLLVQVYHGEHDEEVVLLGHTVDVAHAGVVQQLAVGVEARLSLCPVQVTLDRGGGFKTHHKHKTECSKSNLNRIK